MARGNSARSHFDVTWLEKTRSEVTSGPHLDVTSKSLRSHLPRGDSSRGHFEVSQLCEQIFEKTVPVTPNSEALSSARPHTEDGYPRVHTSIYIYIYNMYTRMNVCTPPVKTGLLELIFYHVPEPPRDRRRGQWARLPPMEP